jgi:hypothetical protein
MKAVTINLQALWVRVQCKRRLAMNTTCRSKIACVAVAMLVGTAAAQAARADPGGDMVAVLPARGPHPSLGHHADLFGRFVGRWDADYSFIAQDGSARHSRGEVLFGWILDGYALQDIFLSYPKPGSTDERKMVTGVRFVDPKTDKWTVMFAAPAFGAAVRMEGGAEGDRIVLRGRDNKGALLRWSFNDIRPDSFVWRGETSHDDGKTWVLEEEHHMTRRGQASGSAR